MKRQFRTEGRAWALAAVVISGGMLPATAADLGGNCCADLEERIAELEATTARKGNRKVKLTVSGQINEAIIFWDDGAENNAYIATNEYAQSRVRFLGDAKIGGDWSAGYLLEIGVRGARADRLNQNDDNGGASANTLNIRHSAWWLANKQLGKVWVGQTSEATDGITEANTANTGHFATPSWGNTFGDGGSGFFLRRKDGGLSGLQWGDFGTAGVSQGVPGEGHRLNVIKYETPAYSGFIGSASWGEDDVWSAALRYGGEVSGFKLAAGVGYTSWTDHNVSADNRGAGDTQEIGLSASALHIATGLFATGAWGRLEDDGLAALYPGRVVDDETEFYFVQAGIEQKFTSIGKTTIFGEYFDLTRGAGFNPAVGGGTPLAPGNLGPGTLSDIAGSEIRGWGLGLNQNVSEVIDLYISYRHVSLDVTTTNAVGIGAVKSSLEDIDFLTAGAFIKF
jgi:hypothetical protein